MIKLRCMTSRLKKMAIAAVLIVALVRLPACTAVVVNSAKNASDDAAAAAKCADDEAKKNPALRASANKASDAADRARAASDKAAKYADIDELKADAKRKDDEAKAAEAAADAAEAEAAALKPKVEAYTNYLAKQEALTNTTKARREAAEKAAASPGDLEARDAYDAAQALYVSADRAMPDADFKFKG